MIAFFCTFFNFLIVFRLYWLKDVQTSNSSMTHHSSCSILRVIADLTLFFTKCDSPFSRQLISPCNARKTKMNMSEIITSLGIKYIFSFQLDPITSIRQMIAIQYIEIKSDRKQLQTFAINVLNDVINLVFYVTLIYYN